MKEIKTLRPFTKFCVTIGNLPTSYTDSLTYEEQLLWLCNYIKNTVIPAINDNAEAVQELQNLYNQLKEYVDHYFDNLDVQEEINNKLDEMVESGTLQEIISEYLNSTAVFGFDSVDDMKNATNLINGSFAKTLGFYDINDGGEAIYKIRNITNNDVVDEMFIISLNNVNLIAELIYLNKINVLSLGIKNDGTTDNTTKLQSIINKLNSATLYFPTGQYNISGITLKSNISLLGDGKTSILYNISDINNTINIIGAGTNYPSNFSIKNLKITSEEKLNYENDTRSGINIYLARMFELENLDITHFKYGIKGYEYWYTTFKNIRTAENDIGMYLSTGIPTQYYDCNIQENRIGLYLYRINNGFNWYGGQIGGSSLYNIFYDNTIAQPSKEIKFDGVNIEEGRNTNDIQLGIDSGDSSNGILSGITFINCYFHISNQLSIENKTGININYGISGLTVINCEFTNYVNCIKKNGSYGSTGLFLHNKKSSSDNAYNINNNIITSFTIFDNLNGNTLNQLSQIQDIENINSKITFNEGYSTQYLKATKNNKTVSINFRTDSSSIANNTTLFTLDESIRPGANLCIPIVGLTGNGVSINGYGIIIINGTTGEGTVLINSTSSYVSCSFSYQI